jgi:hypothetical protein
MYERREITLEFPQENRQISVHADVDDDNQYHIPYPQQNLTQQDFEKIVKLPNSKNFHTVKYYGAKQSGVKITGNSPDLLLYPESQSL